LNNSERDVDVILAVKSSSQCGIMNYKMATVLGLSSSQRLLLIIGKVL